MPRITMNITQLLMHYNDFHFVLCEITSPSPNLLRRQGDANHRRYTPSHLKIFLTKIPKCKYEWIFFLFHLAFLGSLTLLTISHSRHFAYPHASPKEGPVGRSRHLPRSPALLFVFTFRASQSQGRSHDRPHFYRDLKIYSVCGPRQDLAISSLSLNLLVVIT